MATLSVGQGQAFARIADAIRASRDGDIIEVQAGTYTNDFATITTDITIRSVGGLAKIVAAAMPPNGKAIFVTRGDITIQGLEFTGTRVPDGNGAGIRFEGGNLTILDSFFHGNQNGLLSGAWPDGTITIRRSEFGDNGAGDGRTHGLYVGRIKTLLIEQSYFHDTKVGHNIKSRAYETIIRDSRIQDENGTASYSVDLPKGGVAVLTGNVIEQGARSQNPAIVHFGGEGTPYAGSSLLMQDNLVINGLSSPSTRLLLNQTSFTASITGTDVFGLTAGEIARGPANVSGTTFLAARPPLDTSAPWIVPGGGGGTEPGGGAAPILGTAGGDTITLAQPADGVAVDLLGGTDRLVLSAAGPNTVVVSNVERIIGGGGADSVTIATQARGTVVELGGGADRLVLGFATSSNNVTVSGVETVIGSANNDTVTFSAAISGGSVDLGAGGADQVRLSSTGPNALTVTGVESVTGGSLADSVTVAGAGAATLDGGAGNDTLIGGAGADRLIGGLGADRMTGGAGADRFQFRLADHSPLAAPDLITDFQPGVDDLLFTGLKQGVFAWRGASAFTGTGNSEARMEAGSALLLVDLDGNGAAEMAISLVGSALAGFGAGDFVWN